ncbi:hypothetical protein B0H11DRAFT_2234996 [Mycena galericulata]|nr:hypothetical protein B0H11DRAFT_2234996 [Mycena galericulata]
MASSSRTFKRNASAVSTRQLPPPAKIGRVYTPVAEDDDPMFDTPRIELEEFILAPLPSSSQSSTLPLQTIAPTSPLSRKSRRKGRQKASSQQASTQAIEEEREDKTQAGPSVKSKTASNLNFQRLIISCTHFIQRPAHQERQNQAKREQRAQPDYRAQQVAKRAASDEASNSDIAEAWIEETSQWLCLMRRLHQLLAAPASPSSAKTTLRAIHDVVASYEHLEPLVPEVWDLLSERTAVFLLQSAKGLTKSELEKAVKDGILDLSDADDLRPFSGQLFYIRVAVPQESATLATPLLSYIITHPADTPWTIVQLLRLDLDLSLICAAITSTLSPHGHAEAVNMFFDWLRASDHYLDFLQRPRLPYQDNLVYAGESHNCRPGIRHLDDVEAQLPTRLGNCLQALEESHTWQCYQIVDLDLPNSSGLRTDRIASDMEALLVSLPLSSSPSHPPLSVGNLFIVPYNEDAAALALLIPNFHSGVCKYEPALAYLAEKIIHLVGMIEHVALALVEDLRVQGVIPNRSDPNLAWEYFESLRQAIEVKLATTDVRTQLENTKQQYSCLARTSRKLRTLKTDYSNTVAAPDTVAAPYIIPGITESTPRGAPRVAQYHIIMELARSLMKGGMNPDPYHLIPFQFREDIFGSACMEWFMSREENIRYSAAARAYGGSLKAHENSLAGQQRFAADTAAHSRGGFAATEVLRAKRKEREDSREKLRKIAEVISEPLRVRKGQKPNGNHSTVDDNRYGLCPHCGAWILGIDQNCYHKCEPNSSPVKLTEDNIPSLIRLLYVHDIYNNEELASYLPSLTDLRLRRLPTQEIMDRSGNMDVLLTTFPGADVSRVESWPSIYVRADDVDEDMEFTLAVDSILPMLSTCPSDFVPINSKQRGAPWGSCRAPPDEWIGKHLLRCDFGTLALVNPPLQHHYDHACSQTAQRENAERQEKQRLGLKYSQNKSAGGPRDCGTQQATPITSLLQLPSEYLR